MQIFPDLASRLPARGERRLWRGLAGGAAGLATARAIASAGAKCVLVLQKDTEGAEHIAEELVTYLGSSDTVFTFPDWETLLYDAFSPHQDIISARLTLLNHLASGRPAIVVAPALTAMHRLAPQHFTLGRTLLVENGQRLDLVQMRLALTDAAYYAVETVFEHGEFAIRGSILDIFPMGSDCPFRIDLFDDEVESIRTFDPETQRSIDRVDAIRLLPARELPLDDTGIRHFQDQWHLAFQADPRRSPLYQDVSRGIAPPGIEYYQDLFFEQTETLFDYLPADTLVFHEDIEATLLTHWRDATERYENLRYDVERPILPPERILVAPDAMLGALGNFARVQFDDRSGDAARADTFPAAPLPDVAINERSAAPLAGLASLLADTADHVLVATESEGRREVVDELLARHGLHARVIRSWTEFLDADSGLSLAALPLERGFLLNDASVAVVTEQELFEDQVLQRRRRDRSRETAADMVIKSLTELREGSPVVHIDHGVGRYLGLQTLTVDDQVTEFLTLGYQDDARLYVPVSSLHLISRYSGTEEETAPLHKLGGDTWQKAKRKAAEQIHDVAAELLNIYARREARRGFAYPAPGPDYQRFAAGFRFEETPDQQIAIEQVIADMMAERAMDRLVCGDVGFGKTEVAMRAAFLAVHAGKQVTVLVPTTLLAQQHGETFRDRFADWPVTVETISRFRTKKEQTDIIERMRTGKVDIVIGTHALLQAGLDFKDLGLLIIDEEHRFGVRQKETIKSLRAEVDILTLTATPIPRTLNMAMSGMRDLTIIATPPARRLSIKTFVRQHQEGLVKEAITRELNRGGQVYYLHNEVKSIERTAENIQAIVPEARIGIGHGQMRERELEQVMSAFYHKKTNVLVCTTIIETGIDVPSANTIIMDRADKFGLAQVHQLRGRVGRSHHQAYAYLLTPHRKSMTADAIKRLDAISDAEDLGAGFILASHDLEIRGAGELLGDEQTGHLQSVGFTLYMEMLERAVSAIKEGKTPNLDRPLREGTEVNLRLPALIPDDYLPDVHHRLVLYKRISNAENEDELRELQVEMIDRFGLLPDPAKNLLRVTGLKLKAETLGIRKIDLGAAGGKLEFGQETPVHPGDIVRLVQDEPHRYKLRGGNQLVVEENLEKPDTRFQKLDRLLDRLGARATGIQAAG